MNTPDFDSIKAILDAAAENPDLSPDEYLALLARVAQVVSDRQRSGRLAKFGAQFAPAGERATNVPAEALFQPMQQVYTCEGYLGYIAGHDKHGKAIVNVVWEAAEYPESKLHRIPGPSVLDAMRS